MIRSKTVNIDVIRILAGYLIVSVHFFLMTGYYQQIFLWGDLYLFTETCIRSFSIICVPFLMMLSGYLLINKTEFNKEYFIKRCKPFIIYIMFSVLTGVIGTRGFSFFFTHYSVWQIITDMLSFKHACYIEFYFGFVLLIPYLNKMWANSNMTEKQLLILSLGIISSMSPITNVYNFSDINWWGCHQRVLSIQSLLQKMVELLS